MIFLVAKDEDSIPVCAVECNGRLQALNAARREVGGDIGFTQRRPQLAVDGIGILHAIKARTVQGELVPAEDWLGRAIPVEPVEV